VRKMICALAGDDDPVFHVAANRLSQNNALDVASSPRELLWIVTPRDAADAQLDDRAFIEIL